MWTISCVVVFVLITTVKSQGSLVCTNWVSISGTGDGWTGSGTVTVNQANDMVSVRLENVIPRKDGSIALGDFIGHVHLKECEDDASGGHWKVNPVGRADRSNELWAGGMMSSLTSNITDFSQPIPGQLNSDVKSFTLHEKISTNSPKRICCNLAPQQVIKTLSCDDWVSIEGSGNGWTASGLVEVMQTNANEIGVRLNNMTPFKQGSLAMGEFIGHVHNQPCQVDASGGHYKIDPSGPADTTNELWAGGSVSAAMTTLNDESSRIGGVIEPAMRSFTLHEKLAGSAPKRVCCNLAPPKVIKTLTCDAWVPIEGSGRDYTASGTVRVTQTDRSTVAVELTNVSPAKNNVPHNGNWIGHVHNEPCEVNASGGHWQVNANGPADPTNELWAGGTISNAQLSINDVSQPISGELDTTVQSFTLHEKLLAGGAPKRVCCNLKPRLIERALTCERWVGVEGSGAGWSGSGAVRVTQGTDGTVDVAIENVVPMLGGQAVTNAAFIGHVHNQACEVSAGGGHWQVDPNGPVDTTNELWAGGETTSLKPHLSDSATPIAGQIDDEMRSFVLHERQASGAPKRICCNLAPPSVTKTLVGGGAWTPIAGSGDGWSGSGTVRVTQHVGNLVAVAIEDVLPLNGVVAPTGDFIGHVHNKPCNVEASGGHWKVDPNGPVDQANELWAGGVITGASSTINDASAPIIGVLDGDVRSFTLHERTASGAPKRICVDLQPARETAVLTCSSWTPLSSGASWSATGEVRVTETSGNQVGVELINVVPQKAGAAVTGDFIGHVHNQACANGDSGGHWMVDPDGPADPSNELWAGGALDAVAKRALNDRSELISGQLDSGVMSFTLHEKLSGSSPKRVCCNLVRKMACSSWQAIEGSGDGWGGSGAVVVTQTNDPKVAVETFQVTPLKSSGAVEGTFIGHVHNKRCEVDASGGHWQVNPNGPVDTSNELWSGPADLSAALPSLSAASTPIDGRLDDDVQSFTLHEKLADSAPKRICCNLASPTTIVKSLSCADWEAIEGSGAGWGATGQVNIVQTADGRVQVALDSVQPWQNGSPKSGDFIGHVHNKFCADEQSGGHWKVDPSGPADRTNELWAGGMVNTVFQSITDQSTPINGFLDDDVKSFTLHERLSDGSAPKRVCCNVAQPKIVKTLSCDSWTAIAGTGSGWSATGLVRVQETEVGQVFVALADVAPTVNGAAPTADLIGHVHNKQCDVDASGGHWQVNPNGPVDTTNELWAGGAVSPLSPSINDRSKPINGAIDADIRSFTIHEKLSDGAPKRVCCNLVQPAAIVQTLACSSWKAIEGTGAGWTASGSVAVDAFADNTIGVRLVDVALQNGGSAATGEFIGHVHNKNCAVDQSGGHFQVNPNGPVDTTNELWAGGSLLSNTAKLNDQSSPIVGSIVDAIRSFTIHEKLSDGAPKRICCDLQGAAVLPQPTPSQSQPTNNNNGGSDDSTTRDRGGNNDKNTAKSTKEDTNAVEGEDSGLSGGEVAGIVIGVLLLLCCCIGLILLLLTMRRKKQKQERATQIKAYTNYDEVGASDIESKYHHKEEPKKVTKDERSSITDADDSIVQATMKSQWQAVRKRSKPVIKTKKKDEPRVRDQSIIDMSLYNTVTASQEKPKNKDQSIISMDVYSAVANRESFRQGLQDE